MAMIHNSLEFNKYIYKQLIPPYPIQLAAIKGLNVDTILDVDTSALIICKQDTEAYKGKVCPKFLRHLI